MAKMTSVQNIKLNLTSISPAGASCSCANATAALPSRRAKDTVSLRISDLKRIHRRDAESGETQRRPENQQSWKAWGQHVEQMGGEPRGPPRHRHHEYFSWINRQTTTANSAPPSMTAERISAP